MTNQSNAGSHGPYYYLLGYPSEFWTEEDKATGERIAERNPEAAQGARHNLIAYTYFTNLMIQARVDGFLDLGAGVPLNGVHLRAPDRDALYVDNDPNVIKLMNQYVAGPSNVHIMESRLQEVDSILERAEQVFGDKRHIGIVMMAVVYFIDDDSLRYVAQRLYDWCSPGSILAISALRPDMAHAGQQKMVQEYREQRKLGIFLRTEDELLPLVEPWKLHDSGVRELEDIAEEVNHETYVHPGRRGKVGFGLLLTRS